MTAYVENVARQFVAALPASVASRVLSEIEDRPPVTHSEADRRKGGQFGARLKRLQPYGYRLSCGVVYRQAFLWGVANYLKGLHHEELIIAFGVARGNRTRIDSVMKIRGESERVTLSPDKALEIHAFLNQDERHRALFVHNHPDGHPTLWLLGLVVGGEPLPSLIDRNFAARTFIARLQEKITGWPFKQLQFYLVQNDLISEFSGSSASLFLDALRLLAPATHECSSYQNK